MRPKHGARAAKARRESGSFVALPAAVLRSQEFVRLSPYAVKLLLDLLAQFNGANPNNGDLCSAWRLMKQRGWRSKDTLWKALTELRDANWLELTRQGGRHVASLYAVTFFAIDYCGGKLEVKFTGSSSGAWRDPRLVATAQVVKLLPRLSGQSPDDCTAGRVTSTDKAA